MASTDSASFRNAESVNRVLQQAPDIRVEAVEKARDEVSGVQYPPLKTIQAIAHLLAMKLSQDDDEQ